MDSLSFTLPEIFSLIGVSQCVYLIVHLLFQKRKASTLPLVYFFALAAAFLSDAMLSHLSEWEGYIFYLQWGAWFIGPPLSVLLIVQIAEPDRSPAIKDFWVILLLPLTFMLSTLTVEPGDMCSLFNPCSELKELLTIMGLLAGTVSLLVIFSKKNLFKNIRKQKYGAERYWLALTLILLNALFLATVFAYVTDVIESDNQMMLLRTVFGLGFVYLVSTNLLRIFPAEGKNAASQTTQEDLSEEELALAKKIENLLNFDKVYQEPMYSRGDLARECGVSEMVVSKVINVYFDKSFPQIMNERRIEDAKQLLKETQATIKTVAEEVGFNSLPSFNRVFKEMVGQSPGEFRKSSFL